jgi:glycosyltransferase involved in cell wall biosynthesis
MINFDVVIPCKGKLEFITYTLESLAKSTILPNKVIIVDDGILDQIKTSYPGLKVEIIKNRGSGLVHALNSGFAHSNSQYIARIDSDDLVTPNRFENQIETLIKNPNIGVVGTQTRYINQFGEVNGESNYPIGIINSNKLFNKICLIAHPSTMIKVEAFEMAGRYRNLVQFKKTDLGEDYDLWLRISLTHEIHNLESVLTEYRQHTNQLSTQNAAQQAIATVIISAVNRKNMESNNLKFPILIEEDLGIPAEVLELISKNSGILAKNLIIFYQKNSKPSFKIQKVFNKLMLRIIYVIYKALP